MFKALTVGKQVKTVAAIVSIRTKVIVATLVLFLEILIFFLFSSKFFGDGNKGTLSIKALVCSRKTICGE
jgi:hypothetical protein